MLYHGARRPSFRPAHSFIRGIRSHRPRRPLDAILAAVWFLILLKCVLASYCIEQYGMPVRHLYIWVPSFLFGAFASVFWLYRE